jgi:hypothetical protein
MEALLLNLEIKSFTLTEPVISTKNVQRNANYLNGNLRGQYAASRS